MNLWAALVRWVQDNKYLSASGLGIVSRFVSAGCRFISLPLVITLLDRERYGLWLMITSILSWLALTDFGIPSALQNPLVAALAANNRDRAAGLLRYARGVLFKTGVAITCIGVPLIYFLPLTRWLGVDASHGAEFNAALAASVLVLALAMPVRVGAIVAYAVRRPQIPPLTDIVVQLVSLGLLLLCAWYRLASLFVLVIAVNVVQLAVNWGVLRHLVRVGGLQTQTGDADLLDAAPRRQLRATGFSFLFVLIGEGLVLQTDALIIGGMKGASVVPMFIVPCTLFMQFLFLQNAFLRPLWPMLAEAEAVGDKGRLRHLLGRGLLYSALASVVFALGLGFAGSAFVRLWTHGTVNVSATTMWGFGCYVVVSSFGNVMALFCNAVGLVNYRLGSILFFGVSKVAMAVACLTYFDIGHLPYFYAATCLVTDTAILSLISWRHLRGRSIAAHALPAT